MHADASQPSNIECPRCGYLLESAVRRAKELGGELGAESGHDRVTCSECGLESEVRHLEEGAPTPPWFIESENSHLGVVARFVRTTTRVWWPHEFWKRVRMDAPFDLRATLSYIGGIAICFHLAAIVLALMVVVSTRVVPPRVVPVGAPAALTAGSTQPSAVVAADLALAILNPYCPAYGGDILVAAAQGDPNRAVNPGTLWRAVKIACRMTVVRHPVVVTEAPLAPDAAGTFAKDPRSDTRYPTASATVFVSNLQINTQRGRALMLAISALPLLAVLLLLLLPASFRRLRIRRTHLARAAVYALGWSLFALVCHTLLEAHTLFGVRAMNPSGVLFDSVRVALGSIAILGTGLFSILWLHAFVKHYLRLPHAALVTALLHTIVILAGALVVFRLDFA